MRGAFVFARPPSWMASSMASTGASRTALQVGKRAVSDAKVRSVFTSAVFCERTV